MNYEENKVRLIKEEILRRKQSWQHSDKQYEHGGKDVCDYLLGFIDSLPEQPASEDLEEEINNWRHNHFHGRRDKDASGEYLERKSQLDLARHFAKWQKQKDLQDFLEKAEEFFNDMYDTMGKPALGKKTIELFKNYMQNEM